MIRAGLVGVTGYTGMELSRILASHPSMRLVAATSRQDAGKRLDSIYPFLQGLPGADVVLIEPDAAELARQCGQSLIFAKAEAKVDGRLCCRGNLSFALI